MKLKLTHLEQLEMYIDSYADSGFYYGNREQFIKRHSDLKEFVQELQHRAVEKRWKGVEIQCK